MDCFEMSRPVKILFGVLGTLLVAIIVGFFWVVIQSGLALE